MGKTKRRKNGFLGGTYIKEKVKSPIEMEYDSMRKAESKLARKPRTKRNRKK